jgi:hypothetical protein
MQEMLENLLDGLEKYLEGKMSFEEIEHRLTSPIITDESDEELPENIRKIVFDLDMWDANNLSRDEIASMHIELQNYLK